MHLMRTLFFFTAAHQLVVAAVHVPGRDNGTADDISSDRVSIFYSLVSQAVAVASAVPADLVSMLITTCLDWTSSEWKTPFISSLQKVLPRLPSIHTGRGNDDTYLRFCSESGHTPTTVSKHILCSFVAKLANEYLRHRTIKAHLLAVCHL